MFSKPKIQLSPFGLLTVGLTIVTLLTALSGLWHYQYELAHQSAPPKLARNVPNAEHQQLIAQKNDQAALSQATTGPSSTAASHAGSTAPGGSISAAGAGSASSLAAPAAAQPARISATLSLNGQSKGTVSLVAGSNQCDVLSQALADGLISNLDVNYDAKYGTEAVYVIDGIGKPGVVHWQYSVNGKLPPKGCSLIAVHDSDVINWFYP